MCECVTFCVQNFDLVFETVPRLLLVVICISFREPALPAIPNSRPHPEISLASAFLKLGKGGPEMLDIPTECHRQNSQSVKHFIRFN